MTTPKDACRTARRLDELRARQPRGFNRVSIACHPGGFSAPSYPADSARRPNADSLRNTKNLNDNADNDPRIHAIPDIHGHAKGEHKAFSDERPIPLSARMLFLWFYHACRRGWPRFLMVSDHMNYLTFEDPAAINLVRRALKLAQAGDLYGAAETASVEVGHAAVVSEGLRRGMRYSIGAEVDNDPRSRPDAQNIVDAMKPDGMIRSVHFLTIDHPTHGPNWNWPFDNPEFADVYDIVGTAKTWEIYMTTLLDAVERLPGNIVGHFYVPALFGHWPDHATLETYEDQIVAACAQRGMAIELNTRFLYRDHSDEERAKYLAAHRRLLAKCKAKSVGVAVGSDAHSPKDQGRAFAIVLPLLDECGINELVFPIAGRLAHVALRVERKAETPSTAAPAAAASAADDRKAVRKPRTSEAPTRSKDSSSKRDESYASDEGADDAAPTKAKPRPKRSKNRTASSPDDANDATASSDAAATDGDDVPANSAGLAAGNAASDDEPSETLPAGAKNGTDANISDLEPGGEVDGSDAPAAYGAIDVVAPASEGVSADVPLNLALDDEERTAEFAQLPDAAAVRYADAGERVEPVAAAERDATDIQASAADAIDVDAPVVTPSDGAASDGDEIVIDASGVETIDAEALKVNAVEIQALDVDVADIDAAAASSPKDAASDAQLAASAGGGDTVVADEPADGAAAPILEVADGAPSPADAPDENNVDAQNAEGSAGSEARSVEPVSVEMTSAIVVDATLELGDDPDDGGERAPAVELPPVLLVESMAVDSQDSDARGETPTDLVKAAVYEAAAVALASEPPGGVASRRVRPRPAGGRVKPSVKTKPPAAKSKPAAKKAVKPVAKAVAKKASAKKSAAKKTIVKGTAAKKTTTKKAAVNKAAVRPPAAKKAGVKKAGAKKAGPKKPAPKRR